MQSLGGAAAHPGEFLVGHMRHWGTGRGPGALFRTLRR